MEPTLPEPAAELVDPASGWWKEALHSARKEARLFFETLGFSLRPKRFVASWCSGEKRAMNPVGFMASVLACCAVLDQLEGFFLQPSGGSGATSFASSLLLSIGPYLHYVVLGVLCHVLLLAFGSRRSLFGSVAVALFAGGLPILACELLMLGLSIWGGLHHLAIDATFKAFPVINVTVLISSFLLYGVTLVRGLGTFHRVGVLRCVTAIVVAILACGFFFGMVDPPGKYGLHLKLSASLSGKHLSMNYGLSFGQ